MSGKSHIQDVPDADIAALVRSGTLRGDDRSKRGSARRTRSRSPCRRRSSKTRDPDMSYVIAAADAIDASGAPGRARRAREHDVSRARRAKSLLPALTSRGLTVGEDVFVAFSPERVDPGNPVYHTKNTPKVVGGITPACTELASALYASCIDTIVPVSQHGSGGAGQAAREHVPLGEHRHGQRDGDRLRQARRRRVGSDRRRGDEAIRLHEIHAGPGHRRTLHSARPALPRVEDAHAELQDAVHRSRERDQQPDAGVRRRESRRTR